MKIYISGPITGTDDYMDRFANAEKRLKENGYEVINPALVNSNLPESTNYGEYMAVAMVLLKMCDCIYMLDGWKESNGAREEYSYAMANGYFFRYENRKAGKENV